MRLKLSILAGLAGLLIALSMPGPAAAQPVDPIDPPENLACRWSSTTQITCTWDAVADANYYGIRSSPGAEHVANTGNSQRNPPTTLTFLASSSPTTSFQVVVRTAVSSSSRSDPVQVNDFGCALISTEHPNTCLLYTSDAADE